VALGTISELRRPVPLGLGIAVVALLAVGIIMAVQQGNERRAHARHITMLVTAQEDFRRQLAQQQATAGTLTELQARAAASEQEGKLATLKLATAREELAALELRRAEAQQRGEEADKLVNAQARQLATLQAQVRESTDTLAAAARDIAHAHAERDQLQAEAKELAAAQAQLASVSGDLAAKTTELASLDKLLSATRSQLASQQERTRGATGESRENEPEGGASAPLPK
jgi:chromosome segregation ATPase